MLKFLNSRRFRQGSVATAITVIVLALIVVLNMIVSTLSDRYSLSADLTANKIFGISEETKEFLNELDKDVDIYVLDTEANFSGGGTYYLQASEVIKKYAQQSAHINLHYIDLVRNPSISARFPDLQLNTGSIVVSCGDKSKDLSPYDLYNIESNSYITSSKAEQALTSAILDVTSDAKIAVTFITGHNESTLEAFKSMLNMNYYEVVECNLLLEEISTESKIAVMCAPLRDLSDDELKKLDKYLDNNGKLGTNLLYFASVDQPDLPKLSAFLADWGIEVGIGVVFESSLNRVADFNIVAPIVDYNEDVYAKTVLERNMFTLVPYARPMTTLFNEKSSIQVTVPLSYSQTSGIIPPDADENWQPKETDLIGPIPALILSQKTAYEGMDKLNSAVVACASSLAVEDSVISSESFGNGRYFLNMINVLSERESAIDIQPKAADSGTFAIEPQQQILLGLLLALAIPAAVLILGIVIWLGRRHR